MKLPTAVLQDFLDYVELGADDVIMLKFGATGADALVVDPSKITATGVFYPWPEGKRPDDAPASITFGPYHKIKAIPKLFTAPDTEIELHDNKIVFASGKKRVVAWLMSGGDKREFPRNVIPAPSFTLTQEQVKDITKDIKLMEEEKYTLAIKIKNKALTFCFEDDKTSPVKTENDVDADVSNCPDTEVYVRWFFSDIRKSIGPVTFMTETGKALGYEFTTPAGVKITRLIMPFVPE